MAVNRRTRLVTTSSAGLTLDFSNATGPDLLSQESPAGGSHAPVQPSRELGAVVGSDRLSRNEVVTRVWDYIKKNNLQNPSNKREILADDKLSKIFGEKKVTMFEMNKHIARHLKA